MMINGIYNILSPLENIQNPIIYELATTEREVFVKRNIPSGLSAVKYLRTYKRDIYYDCIIEEHNNINVYYIDTNNGKGDELYYFELANGLYHGDKIWSRYHPFIQFFDKIKTTHYFNKPSLFVGTRNNYTHQLVDFLPNLLISNEYKTIFKEDKSIVLGKPNKIIDQLLAMNSLKLNNEKLIWLNLHGPSEQIGRWRIRKFEFRNITIIRHLSVFRCFQLIKKHLLNNHSISNSINNQNPQKKIGIIRRHDDRVQNLEEILVYLSKVFELIIIENIEALSFEKKSEYFSQFDILLVPPGSDNINAMCFCKKECIILLLSPFVMNDKILEDPYYSIAGLRYDLPFLNKIVRIPPILQTGQLSAIWCSKAIRESIEKAIYTNP